MTRKLRLDKKDQRLLYELDLPLRQTASSLGKKVRLSNFGVAYRIKRLLNLGVIKGFYSLIDVCELPRVSPAGSTRGVTGRGSLA